MAEKMSKKETLNLQELLMSQLTRSKMVITKAIR